MTLRTRASALLRDRSGLAMVELAYGLPLFLAMALPGIEVANFVTTKMRMSQVALHIADHAARMGTGSLLAAKTISESEVNDVLIGAGMQSGELDVYKNGRIILSSLEPMANPNTKKEFKITWQRCKGDKVHPSSFGTEYNATTKKPVLKGMGFPDRVVGAPNGNITMFVEVYYEYKPILGTNFTPWKSMTETAAMTVRERRESGPPVDDAVKAAC